MKYITVNKVKLLLKNLNFKFIKNTKIKNKDENNI
jgi:hypothetical protein